MTEELVPLKKRLDECASCDVPERAPAWITIESGHLRAVLRQRLVLTGTHVADVRGSSEFDENPQSGKQCAPKPQDGVPVIESRVKARVRADHRPMIPEPDRVLVDGDRSVARASEPHD